MRPMKIAYIGLKGIPFCGGIEKYTEELGSRLAIKGHHIIVYTMKHYATPNSLYKGMKIKTVPTIKTKSSEKIIASFMAIIYQCIEKDIDIVHLHAFGPSMFGFLPKILGRKVVVQGHGLEWKRAKWKNAAKLFLKITEFPSVKFPHAITVVSKAQKKYLKERYGLKSTYIPTGVNPPTLQPPYLIKQKYGLTGSDYILFAARLVEEKGAHYLIDAYKKLKTNIKLVIAGDDKYEQNYKNALYESAKDCRNIIFTGFATGRTLQELFSNCCLFVLPSEIEGLPTAVLEAMSYGKCCLASDIDENIEALADYGYTFKNKDVNSLREKIETLLSQPSLVNEKGTSAAQYVLKNFSWDDISSKFEKLYENLLS